MSIKYRQNKRQEKEELIASKSEIKLQKKQYSISKEKRKVLLKQKNAITLEKYDKADKYVSEAKKQLRRKKKEYKEKKRNFNRKYPNKSKLLLKESARKFQNQQSIMNEDEELARYSQAKQRYGVNRYRAEKALRDGKKISRYAIKGAYGIGNRTYNKIRGGGFRKTPTEYSWYYRLKTKIQTNKRVQQLKELRKTTKPFTRPVEALVRNIYKNPLKISGLLSILAIVFIISLFISSLSPAKMKELDMSETWIHFTKIDREKSTDKVIYYSNIEDYIHYLNYRYDKSMKDIFGNRAPAYKKKLLPETREGRNYLEGMWEFLNEDENNLKSIEDLVKEKGEYGLDEKEQKEWQDIKKIAEEIGKFAFAKELDNFLYDKKDKSYNNPMKILERYGYKDKETKSDTTTFLIKANNYIYAPITGQVEVAGSNVSIQQGMKRVTFYNLQNIRLTSGSQAIRNEIIGEVKQEGNQEVKYEKRLNKDGKDGWYPVNIGFYLPSVEYVQKTQVIRKMDLDSDKISRIREFIDNVKKYEPNATNEGLAGILGNFDIESGINPKRAEGDYLNPPIGASEDSWDNPDWLNIGGMEIYNGRYPNILRRGLGLGQWTDTADGAIRHTLLRNFANDNNSKWYYMDLQVNFIFNGDSPYYRQIFREIATSEDDVENTTRRFLTNWEGNYGDKIESRIERAKEILNYLKSGGGSAGSFKDPKDQELWNKVASTYNSLPGSGGLKPHVAQMRAFLLEKFDLGVIGGYRHDSDGTGHGHGDGLALDLMLPVGDPKGHVITRYLEENFDDLRIYYIIYEQRFYMNINNIYGPPNSWNLMPDRGSITQNHFDHVHISFKNEGE